MQAPGNGPGQARPAYTIVVFGGGFLKTMNAVSRYRRLVSFIAIHLSSNRRRLMLPSPVSVVAPVDNNKVIEWVQREYTQDRSHGMDIR